MINILARLQSMKTLVFDMDGVLTDGGLIIQDGDNWYRRMNVKDGYAIQLAVKKEYRIIVISGSDSPPAEARLRKLGVQDVFMQVKEKRKFLQDFAARESLDFSKMVYMGDDIPDFEVMQLVEIAACPQDAVPEIRSVADYISPFRGGEGCVRDLIEKVLKLNGNWPMGTRITST